MINDAAHDLSALERAMDAIAPGIEAYCADRHELTLLVGLTHKGARHTRAFRSKDAVLAAVPDGQSLFEIGSVSKVFNTTLLAVMESQGLVGLDDTVGSFLPDLDLSDEIANITLFDLATHTAGFDRLARVFAKMYEEDVRVLYLRYSKADLYRELELAELVRPRGTGWEYSIIGASLLGHILELAGGKPWEVLLRELVCEPLGLKDTAYDLTDEQLSRLVRGYDEKGELAPLWYWNVMLPQGGLRSTVDDLLTFAEAHLAGAQNPISDALRRTRRTHFAWPDVYELDGAPGMAPPFRQALGWRTFDWPFGTVDEHGGATLSYQSQLGLCEQTQSGFAAITCYDRAGYEDVMVFPVVAITAMRTALQLLADS